MTFTYNTVVVSDLHLGEDLSPRATDHLRAHINRVEEQLVEFIHYFATRREDGRPWRLVINGDMIDFLAVTEFPSRDDRASKDEREYGMRRTPAVSLRKLEQVITRHRETFRALAEFVARGNRVDIIAGNHDTEMQFPAVQERFRAAVVSSWQSLPKLEGASTRTADAIGEAVQFHPWFFYEKGSLWIEHGHQYDECCSLEHQLYPRTLGGDGIVMNVDTAGARYVQNSVDDVDPHEAEEWSLWGYIMLARNIGWSQTMRLAKGYGMFALSLLKAWRANARIGRVRARARREHQDRVAKLADETGLDGRTLMSLDGLRRRPVVRHLRRLAAVLMVDKLVFFGLGIAMAILCLLMLSPPWGAIGAVGSVVGAKLITVWSGRNRIIDPAMGLELVSERILAKVDAKFVVMGHTHVPVERHLADGGSYYNSGTWVPTGKPGLLRSFTHLVMRHTDAGPHMAIRQWRDGASREFSPGWTAHGTEEAALEAKLAEPIKVRARRAA